MNYYSFHIGDFITATVHLSPMEELAYRRLLDMYYDTEAQIPLETQSVSRRLRMDTEIVDSVLNEFFTRTETGWANHRCDAEIAAYHRKVDANRSNGKLGGRPKKTQSVNLANPVESQQNLNQEPRTNNQEPINKTPAPKSARFDPRDLPMPLGLKAAKWDEWVLYRSKVGKKPKPETWVKQIEFLSGCIAKGFNPADLIDESIRNGWQGLFEPKRQQAPPTKQANRDSYAAQAAQAAARLNIGERNERTDERDITEYCTRVA